MTCDGDIHLAAQRRSRNLNFMAACPPLTATGADTADRLGGKHPPGRPPRSRLPSQQPERIRRIGWLENDRVDGPAVQARTASAKQELEKLGWVSGAILHR